MLLYIYIKTRKRKEIIILKTANIFLIPLLLVGNLFISGLVSANTAPVTVGTIPDQTVTVGGTALTLEVSSYFSDPDDDALRYSLDFSDPTKVSASITGSTASITGTAAGTVTVTVTATDTGALSANQTFTLTVNPSSNQAPVAVGTIPDQTVTIGGASLTVDVSSYFSDPDGDPLSYAFEFSDTSKMNASVTGSTVLFTGVAAGTVTVTATATDTSNLSVTQTFTLTVTQPNRAPVKSNKSEISKQYIGTTAPVTVTGIDTYFTDPDGDTLTYTAASSDTTVATASVSGTTVTVSRVSASSGGQITITVTATDPGGLSATRTFSVTVDPIYQRADTVPGLSNTELALLNSLLTYDTLIINELHNGAVDTGDWLEIRNVSAADIALDTWQLTIRTSDAPVIVTFPVGTVIPAGEVLLLVNAESSLPNLADVSILSVVSETFILPQHGFTLILRSPAAFGDLVSNYAVGAVERSEGLPPLTVGIVWDRSQSNAPGYRAEAWTASIASTPGYQETSDPSVDMNGDGVINILDLVLVAGQMGQPAADNIADVNRDGVINILDLVLVANQL